MTDDHMNENNSEKTDETERLLYRNFINAQYEYFKYIEPINEAKLNKRLEGKVKNPYHWRSQLEERFMNKGTESETKTETEEHRTTSKKKNSKSHKKLLL